MRRSWVFSIVFVLLAGGMATYLAGHWKPVRPSAPLTIDYPTSGTVFPPDIVAPAFRWASDDPDVRTWQVRIDLDDGKKFLQAAATASPWTPTVDQWQEIKNRSVSGNATVTVTGLRADGSPARRGSVAIRTAKEPVGAPLFYREVPLPFSEAVKDPSRIRWRFGSISSATQPPIVLSNLPVCGNCHSFSADGRQIGLDVDYANDKGAYALTAIQPETVLSPDKIISWNDYRREDKIPTFGLLSQISPNGRYVVSTVKDRSVFVAKPELEFSQLFFPIKGILAVYDQQAKRYFALPGADDPQYVQSNPSWSPDGRYIVFARAPAYKLRKMVHGEDVLLSPEECAEFLKEGKKFQFDLYRVPFNDGKGGKAEPLMGASQNGVSNFFAKYSPDGRWIVFCKAASFMLLQPDSELWIVPAEGGEARRLECNTRRMNSWHTWSPNSRWLAFTSKANGPYSQIFLAYIDEAGHAHPPVQLVHFTAADRAANIPEFVNAPPDSLKKIVQQFVDDHSHWRAGNEYLRAKDWAGAERMYRKALELNPKSAEAHHSLAAVLAAAGRINEALPHYQKALEIKPDFAEAHANLALALARLRRVDEAVVHFRKALDIEPGNVRAHVGLADVMTARGQIDEAVSHYRKALEIQPNDVDAHNNLGLALAAGGHVDEAIEHYRKALEIKPDYALAHNNLAMALAGRGQFDEAIAHYEKALKIKPDYAEAHNNLGVALAAGRGQMDAAIKHFQKALEIKPDYTGARENLERAKAQR
jgi:tetratricopeptide (TPR) repeat protein